MKFSGRVGFWQEDVEVRPDVYKPQIIERPYIGDVLRDNRRFQNNNTQNEEFSINNQISILADLYMVNNWPSIRYVVWNNAKVAVKSVNVGFPRITLELGGEWNGETKIRTSNDTDQHSEIS